MAEYEDYIPQSKLADWRKKNTPDTCPILGHNDIIPVVDHDHQTGRIRAVISSQGNALVGKVENFFKGRCQAADWDLPTVLRAIADYLEQDGQGPMHPVGARQLTKRFRRTKKEQQVLILEELGFTKKQIDDCVNAQARADLYRSTIVK